ncbi:MAG TPA: TlpA disulfide reductase family protein [Candidatus Polarisedimenticolaceae bacterium]|nr:TlpA disulfide reductase family protein [Candidatus Polarisedimenticolaceae bacterium]
MRGRTLQFRAWGFALALALVPAAVAAGAGDPFGQTLVRTADGRSVELAPGAPALHVVFLATWCPPCLDEFEALAELEARWGERGYRLVLVPVKTRHTIERLREFDEERRLPGELLFDSQGAAQTAAGATELPTHLLYDASGKQVLRSGAFADGVAAAVASLLENSTPRSPRR